MKKMKSSEGSPLGGERPPCVQWEATERDESCAPSEGAERPLGTFGRLFSLLTVGFQQDVPRNRASNKCG